MNLTKFRENLAALNNITTWLSAHGVDEVWTTTISDKPEIHIGSKQADKLPIREYKRTAYNDSWHNEAEIAGIRFFWVTPQEKKEPEIVVREVSMDDFRREEKKAEARLEAAEVFADYRRQQGE